MNKISVIVPTYNNYIQLMTCLMGLNKTTYPNLEVIVVDDCSKVPVKSTHFPNFIYIRNTENLGFAKSVNAGIDKATGDYICLLNDDILINDNNWLNKLYNEAVNQKVDLVGVS